MVSSVHRDGQFLVVSVVEILRKPSWQAGTYRVTTEYSIYLITYGHTYAQTSLYPTGYISVVISRRGQEKKTRKGNVVHTNRTYESRVVSNLPSARSSLHRIGLACMYIIIASTLRSTQTKNDLHMSFKLDALPERGSETG